MTVLDCQCINARGSDIRRSRRDYETCYSAREASQALANVSSPSFSGKVTVAYSLRLADSAAFLTPQFPPSHMPPRARSISVVLALATVFCAAGASVEAMQPICREGIPCGHACIASNRVCRAAAQDATPEPKERASTLAPLARRGATKVWVNEKAKVYHCPGSRSYGRTRAGRFTSEQSAVTAGLRPAFSRRCV